jgi:hypothetical protein
MFCKETLWRLKHIENFVYFPALCMNDLSACFCLCLKNEVSETVWNKRDVINGEYYLIRCFKDLKRSVYIGFHGGDYEEWRRLGCYALWLL